MAIVHKIHIAKLCFLAPDGLCPQGSSLTPVFSVLSWSGVPVISSKRLTEVISLSSWNWKSFAFLLEWQWRVENSQVALDPSEAFVLPPSALQSWLFLQDLFDRHPFSSYPVFQSIHLRLISEKLFEWSLDMITPSPCPWSSPETPVTYKLALFGFPQLSFFCLTTFHSCFPSSFYSIFSTLHCTQLMFLAPWPPPLSFLRHCLSSCCCSVAKLCPTPLWPHGLQETRVLVLGQLYLCALEIFLTTLTCQPAVFRNCS